VVKESKLVPDIRDSGALRGDSAMAAMGDDGTDDDQNALLAFLNDSDESDSDVDDNSPSSHGKLFGYIREC